MKGVVGRCGWTWGADARVIGMRSRGRSELVVGMIGVGMAHGAWWRWRWLSGYSVYGRLSNGLCSRETGV